MKLYHSTRAPNPERVTFFLNAKGVLDKVEKQEISIIKGEHMTPEYREISPFARVPALQLDDGAVLTESRAICTYIEGEFPDVNLLGNDHKERAQIEMWDRQLEFMWMMPYDVVSKLASDDGTARKAANSGGRSQRRKRRKSLCPPTRQALG